MPRRKNEIGVQDRFMRQIFRQKVSENAQDATSQILGKATPVHGVGTAIWLLLLFGAEKLCALWKTVSFAAVFGTGAQAQAYFAATEPVTLLFSVGAGAVLGSVYLPLYTKAWVHSARTARGFCNRQCQIYAAAMTVLALLGIKFAMPFLRYSAPMVAEGECAELAGNLFRLALCSLPFSTLALLFSLNLQAHAMPGAALLLPLCQNGGILFSLCFAKTVYAVVLGGVLGSMVGAIIGFVFWWRVSRTEIQPLGTATLRIDVLHTLQKQMRRAVWGVLPLSWISPLASVFLMRAAATDGRYGNLAAFGMAQKLTAGVLGVTLLPIHAWFYPMMAAHFAAQNMESAKRLFCRGLCLLAGMGSAAAICYAFGLPLVLGTLIPIDARAAAQICGVAGIFACAIPLAVLGALLGKTAEANGKWRYAAVARAVGSGCVCLCAMALGIRYGACGAALSEVIGQACTVLCLLPTLKQRAKEAMHLAEVAVCAQ